MNANYKRVAALSLVLGFFFFFFRMELVFELMALHLQNKFSIAWATPPVLEAFSSISSLSDPLAFQDVARRTLQDLDIGLVSLWNCEK
jgi:hypothetical protein